MATNRLEILKSMVEQRPDDSFSRYGLAREYFNSGDFEQAIAEYRELLRINPNYSAAYYHGGQALEKLGQLDQARQLYVEGIEVTTRTGDLHTCSELKAALDQLG